METFSAVHSEGWDVFDGFSGTLAQAVAAVGQKPSGQVSKGQFVELRSASGRWRVGSKGGVRRVAKDELWAGK